jgi:GntR family transcriptional regulator/MocR family aminotransferase
VPSVAGLHLSAIFRGRRHTLERDIVARATAAGVGLHGLSDFYVRRPARPGLVFGYGAVPTDQIEHALRRLRACFGSAISGSFEVRGRDAQGSGGG